MTRAAQDLSKVLDHDFRNPELLDFALTHRSAGSRNNERLEFLGDAILSLVIAEALYRQLPSATEGELSRLRATLVRQETLAEIARGLELGEYLTLGSGELKSGGFRRDSILSDALEAIFGALYMDGGFEAARQCIARLFAERLDSLPSAAALKDPKTRLQEYLQSRRVALPEYEVLEARGQAHDQTFRVQCRIPGTEHSSHGQGGSRRKAEQDAAQRMLAALGGE
ncbi:MAG TPA: ribonuclease III [Gammaproteobacteria bacterium]|nr:ribonuclease III [Gammaproteobacteria bacterium]